MADADPNTPLYPTEEGDGGKQKGGKINAKFVLVVAAAGLVLLYQMGVIGPSSEPSSPPQTQTAGQSESQTQPAASGDDQLEPIEEIAGFDTVEPSDRSALVLMQNNMQQLGRRMNDLITSQNAAQQRQVEFERKITNSLDRKMQELTGIIHQLSQGRAESAREIGLGAPPSDESLPFIEGQPVLPGLESLEQAEDSFGYRAYGYGQPADSDSKPTSTSSAVSELLGVGGNKEGSESKAPSTADKEQDNNPLDIIGRKKKDEEKTITVEVPAGSFATARNLHGVDCPIGGGITDDLFSNVPAAMVLTGDFRGPVGANINLRRAQLIGACVGQKSTERARFRITHLSYYDEKDKQHFVPVSGYINDGRDNGLDVAGYMISTQVSDVAKSAAATALSTGANFLSASQFTDTTNSSTGATSRSMSGQLGTAVAGASAADAFGKIAEMYADEVKASMEVIRVPAGVDMTFHTLQPFEMELPDDDYDSLS